MFMYMYFYTEKMKCSSVKKKKEKKKERNLSCTYGGLKCTHILYPQPLIKAIKLKECSCSHLFLSIFVSYITEKKHANHALTTTEAMQTSTQKDPAVVNEISKQQILVQYLKV